MMTGSLSKQKKDQRDLRDGVNGSKNEPQTIPLEKANNITKIKEENEPKLIFSEKKNIIKNKEDTEKEIKILQKDKELNLKISIKCKKK